MTLKVAKTKAFASLQKIRVLKKTIGGEEGQTDTPTLFRVNLPPFDNLPAPVE